jgi:phosphoribosyl-ATP pyrophosphohydrolase
MSSTDILERLTRLLNARKEADPRSSHVARLYDEGLDAILKKIGEEATETVMAAKDGEPQRIVHETADLWFHCLVMLVYKGIAPAVVLTELGNRFGQSGIAEKAGRTREN